MRSTHAVCSVLEVLAERQAYGFQIMRETGYPSGTVYPILHRLESEGAVISEWEDIDPAAKGRPRRRVYWLVLDELAEFTDE